MLGNMMHLPFIFRQLLRSSKQAVVFIFCVALSLSAITAFSGFSESVNRSLRNDARKFHAADIIVRSNSTPSAPLDREIDGMVEMGQVRRARYYEFYSVVRTGDDQASVLADVKVVENGYPFYGDVLLKSDRPFHKALTSGRTIVAQALLDRLGLKVGDGLKVGFSTLVIDDVVTSEPDRPVNLFSFGPRVFVADDDRDALGLIQKGSRVSYVTLLKVLDPSAINPIADQLKQAAVMDQERVDTFQTARSRFKRFFDNFLFFLKLVGFFIMIISGFGIQVTLTAFLKEKEISIAIMKAVGATNRYITRHFMLIVFVLGLSGIVVGLSAGYLIQHGLAWALISFLPANMQVSISWTGVGKGVLLGISVVTMFSFFPLYHLRETRPVMILRRDAAPSAKRWPYMVAGMLFFAFFSGLVFWHMQDGTFSLYFIGAIAGLILITFLFTHLMLLVLRRIPIRQLAFRQAVKGLFRQGNSTKPIVITLTASLCVIFTIYLMEENLNATFVQSYPPDAPNLFFLDIQSSQVDDFSKTIGRDIIVYPVVRARILSINGVAVDRKKEGQKRRDNFSRVFNLTYRDNLMENERIVAGEGLFSKDGAEPEVSILDIVVDMRKMEVGDKIQFRIQGVPLEARISSIRSQELESMSPFFYFVFPEKILKDAPQTIFAALNVDESRVRTVQNTIVARFPNISVIDVSETIRIFSKLMEQLDRIVRFFTLLSIAAGILILISAIFATRAERIIESVYYKVLGAKKLFVFQVFALENMLIGLLSGLLALIMSETAAFMVCRHMFDISYRFYLPSSVLMMFLSVFLIVVIGIVTSKSILDKKPIAFLREGHE